MSNYYDYRLPDRSRSSENSTPSWVVGLLAGAAVGGGLALLFAPRQGTLTRLQLAERSQEAGRQVRQAYESVAGTARRNARRLAARAQDWSREGSGARESMYAGYSGGGEHEASEPSKERREALGEASYSPASVTGSPTAPGGLSPLPSDPRSPFA